MNRSDTRENQGYDEKVILSMQLEKSMIIKQHPIAQGG